MKYSSIKGGHEWHLYNGAIVRLTDLDWSKGGRLYADVNVLTGDGAGALGGGRIELSNIRDRNTLAQDVSSRNGAKPQQWSDALLAIYTRLEQGHGVAEPFVPVDLSTRDEPGPVPFRVQNLLPEALATNIFGDSGQGKTTLASHLGLSVCTGKSGWDMGPSSALCSYWTGS